LTIPQWAFGFAGLLAISAFVFFGFRQGLGVKPDKDNRDRWAGNDGGSFLDGGHPGG
jgi:hypothetical protein